MKLNKALLRFAAVALFGAAVITGFTNESKAYPGTGGRADRVTVDYGDTMEPFVATVGTITAVALYTKQAGRVDRKFVVCNGQAFNLYIGTHSALSASHSATLVPDNSCETIDTPALSLWGIYESGAGAADQVNGYKQYDSRD